MNICLFYLVLVLFFLLGASIVLTLFDYREYRKIRVLLNKYKIDQLTKVAIVLGDWGKNLFSKIVIKPNYSLEELQVIIDYLEVKKQNFSFCVGASTEDVERIMRNKDIREVYFVGHGDSHSFKLEPKKRLFYCEFNDQIKYGKDFVHQVHCGTPDGKSLIEYVVPVENRKQCFFFRKTIRQPFIVKEFKKKIAELHI